MKSEIDRCIDDPRAKRMINIDYFAILIVRLIPWRNALDESPERRWPASIDRDLRLLASG
jgi:hypothetical protein